MSALLDMRLLLIALLLITISVITIVHQYIVWGKIFEPEDVLHHEVLAVSCIILAGAIMFFASRCVCIWRG